MCQDHGGEVEKTLNLALGNSYSLISRGECRLTFERLCAVEDRVMVGNQDHISGVVANVLARGQVVA